jgi:hypothetical protein
MPLKLVSDLSSQCKQCCRGESGLQDGFSKTISNDIYCVCALDLADGHVILPGWHARHIAARTSDCAALAQHLQLVYSTHIACMPHCTAGRQQADSAVVSGSGSGAPRSGNRCARAGRSDAVHQDIRRRAAGALVLTMAAPQPGSSSCKLLHVAAFHLTL